MTSAFVLVTNRLYRSSYSINQFHNIIEYEIYLRDSREKANKHFPQQILSSAQ